MLTQPLKVAQTLSRTVMDMLFPGKCHMCRRFTVNEPCDLSALACGARTLPQIPLFEIAAHNICRDCVAGFRVVPIDACPRCSCELEDGACVNCALHPPRFVDRCMSLLFYNSDISPVIRRFKYGGDLYVGRFLSLCLLAGLAVNTQSGVHYDIITPVPLHPKKQKARKFNQNERLLQYWRRFGFNDIAGLHETTLDFKLIRRHKHTRPQAGLDADARANNVANAFDVRDGLDLSGLNILVADDIVTTGATVENCAKALKAKGASRVDVVSIARTMPHRNPNHLMEI